jgi:hypothetical protein
MTPQINFLQHADNIVKFKNELDAEGIDGGNIHTKKDLVKQCFINLNHEISRYYTATFNKDKEYIKKLYFS